MVIMSKVVLAAIFTFMAMLECSGVDIKIMSFNIEHFGRRHKLWENYVLRRVSDQAKKIVQVLREYDIIFIQEVKGTTGRTALTDLENILNKTSTERTCDEAPVKKFKLVWPECFFDKKGNSETYAYYINTEKIKKFEEGLYPSREFDRKRTEICPDFAGLQQQQRSSSTLTNKWFVRPPYSLCVKDHANRGCLFFLLGLHAKPLAKRDGRKPDIRTTKEELDNLAVAYYYFRKKYMTPHALLMGDLNADGRYLTGAQFKRLELTKKQKPMGPNWIPFTPPTQHTNVAGDSLAYPAMYDRFYATTPEMSSAVRNMSHVITNQTIKKKKISDHYPIALTIESGHFEFGTDCESVERPRKRRRICIHYSR